MGSHGEYSFKDAIADTKAGQPLAETTQILLSQLTKEERLSLLDGDVEFWPGLRSILCDRYNRTPYVHGAISRKQIPGIKFTDGPRGVVMGSSTAFPVPMARGATWDVELERRVGDAIGREAKSQGANYFAGVCVNLPRHPAWGRIQETYGDDPLLLGEFRLALTQSVQKHVMACVKHYALNSMENARFRVDVSVEEAVLHEVYLAHFRRIVEGGVAAVMSSYNSVNGEWAGQNRHLLTEILREQWGFDGLVMSDFIFGLRDAAASVKNGLDIEAPFRQQRARKLPQALESGDLDWKYVDRACERILRKQIEFTVRTEDSQPSPDVVFCDEHRALAREVAARSMVLLKNDTVDGKVVLPLQAESLSRVAVVGRLANIANTGDKGSSQVFPPGVVTPLDGIKAALPGTEVLFADSVAKAEQLASQVDVVICIVGYTHEDEGEYVVPALQDNPALRDTLPPATTAEERETLDIFEGNSDKGGNGGIKAGAGGDRTSLRLRDEDEKLISAVTAHNPRTIVSVITAGAVIMESWKDKVPALLISWYSGSEGGHGLGDVLLGKVDASGRLPFSIPTIEAHLPFFNRNAAEIYYDRWFGQHMLDKLGVKAGFPFGFGLSYATFAVDSIVAESVDKESIQVAVNVQNTGRRPGRFIAQVYAVTSIPDFPTRVLLGFAPVDLDVGQRTTMRFLAATRPIQQWKAGTFTLRTNQIQLEVASFAGDGGAVCRSRRTKCDQKKPRCSFCEKTGAECVFDPTALSTFDPASLAILDRLETLEQKIDSFQRQQQPVPALVPFPTLNPNNDSSTAYTVARETQRPESLLPENLDAVLKWPILQDIHYQVNQSPHILSPSSDHDSPAQPSLDGDELNLGITNAYLDNFFAHVHPKNPVLDEPYIRRLVRKVSLEGPSWDSESCLALLVCANGAITGPLSAPSISAGDLRASPGRRLFTAALKRIGATLDSAGIVQAQCLFFAGVYLMSCLRPFDAWRSFLQALAVCQSFKFMGEATQTGTPAEESIYWSSWKSERELRWELGLPDFGTRISLEPPQRFPTLPLTDDEEILRAWYFYLSEISLWRLETEIRKDMTARLSEPYNNTLNGLADISEIYQQQLVACLHSLPSTVSIFDPPRQTPETDVLRFILQGRSTCFNELITWPYIAYAVNDVPLGHTAQGWVSKGLQTHLERLEVNQAGFYHRHHGTWLMIRTSARSACILLAVARSRMRDLLPGGWKEAVEATVKMLDFWQADVEGLAVLAGLLRHLVSYT
ncbi:Glycosyl hydrolase family 3 N terminal domain protein [Aspergillus parasiticus SU-1]|uniref:beta-glucosidase n=1 Tax=Aspergillus parasiticus (strain ATCC 56775 / NRRL 5862 / SRRC 143 / SU-1) TaxID=1403190 RepID=A0A0F0I582_ASPPU|nr:Glycosyl hydrolase family 3 N terminal domain protein [Aspergillus parasiticus SU-1]